MIPDSVKIKAELDGVKLPTAIPIEIEDVSVMVSDINTAIEKGTWTSLVFTGSMSLSSLKVKEYIPALEKFVGDLSFLEMPDTTVSLRCSPFRFEASAELFFLEEIKLAEAGVHIGNFEYTNSLLQLDGVDVSGVSANLKAGLMWDSADGNLSLELSGEGELDAHSSFGGVCYTGTLAYDISLWFINSEKSQVGNAALGIYVTHDGKIEFVIVYKYQP